MKPKDLRPCSIMWLVSLYTLFLFSMRIMSPFSSSGGTVHGMIVLNVYNPRLLHLLADARIPKVFLDTADSVPPEELNGDMILMENKNSVYKLTSQRICVPTEGLGLK